MAEPFKNLVGPASVERLAAAFLSDDPSRTAAFTEAALAGLAGMELKARVAHVARLLRRQLPAAFPEALARLVAALPPHESDLMGHSWLWPVLQVVEDEAAAHPAESLAALAQMTSRFSAEFALRPLLARHPALAYATLREWARSPDEHVRRLVSEGSRPRLPWGMQLRAAVADPEPGLALLARLVDDPSPYVRRSVANHLGDVAKDHPERAVAIAGEWLTDRPDRLPLVRHGLRSLLKRGHTRALALVGNSTAPVEVTDLAVTPNPARVGESFTVCATVVGEGRVRVDVVWAWPAARGGWSSRTFVGKERELAEGERWAFSTRVSLRPVTTRPMRPGPQRATLRVAGQEFGPVGFILVQPSGALS